MAELFREFYLCIQRTRKVSEGTEMIFQASFSFESRMRDDLKSWGMGIDVFSTIVALEGVYGCGRTKLNDALRGRTNLPNEIAARIEPLTKEIKDLVASVAPLRLNFSNAVEIQSWLAARRRGELDISITTEQR
jgi:hypothetical protein